jgi:hypothetical protein
LYKKEQEDPPCLTNLAIAPNYVSLKSNQGQTFTVQGFDQRNQDFAISNVLWTATGGNINEQGTITAGDIAGNFMVTATVGAIVSTIDFAIEKTPTANDVNLPFNTAKNVEVPTTPSQPNQLTWSGEVTPQKWTQFYTKVLSKFSANKDLKLKLKVEVIVDGEISDQRIEETKIALQELGLDSNIDTVY